MNKLAIFALCFAAETIMTAEAQRLLIPDTEGWSYGVTPENIVDIDAVNLFVNYQDGSTRHLVAGDVVPVTNSSEILISEFSPVKVVNPLSSEGVEVTVNESGEVEVTNRSESSITLRMIDVIYTTIRVKSAKEITLDLVRSQPTIVSSGTGAWHFNVDKYSMLNFSGNPGDYTYSSDGNFPLLDIKNPDRLKNISPYFSTNTTRLLRASSNVKVGAKLEFTCPRKSDGYFSKAMLNRYIVKEGVNDINLSSQKRAYIWIDAAANFKDFANSKANIERDLRLAKGYGFTDIVVDVRSTSGDVLFKTDRVGQVEYLMAWSNGVYGPVYRTADWDYLQAFIDIGKSLGLRVHAAINTMACGHNGIGLPFRDPSKRDWVSSLNTSSGIINMMDLDDEKTKFFNPNHPEVQEFLCGLISDLAKYEGLDGIFLDRGRYHNFQSDFSDLSRQQFEEYIGNKVTNFPSQILPAGATTYSNTTYVKQWIEFRAKTIHDFMVKAREAAKNVNPDINFGVYVGGWYGSYYDVGVNWAAPTYDASATYYWATPKFKDYGFADHMDHMLIGAYASPVNIYGKNEWTIQGFCYQAMQKIGDACPMIAGGPDVGNWNLNGVTPEQEINGVYKSVDAAMSVSDGYFLFDMIHLKLNVAKWEAVMDGFDYFTSQLRVQ